MPTHDITLEVPSHQVVNKDVTVHVRANGALLGRIAMSKGSIDWRPASASKTHYRMSWEGFQKLMEEHGKQMKA
jgi:hypothetical protein